MPAGPCPAVDPGVSVDPGVDPDVAVDPGVVVDPGMRVGIDLKICRKNRKHRIETYLPHNDTLIHKYKHTHTHKQAHNTHIYTFRSKLNGA